MAINNSLNTLNLPLSLTSGTGTVSISADATSNSINIATGAGVKTLTLGSTNSTSATTINSGTGALNIGNSIAKTITIGNATGATGIVLTTGSAGTVFTGFAEGALVTSSAGKVSTVTGTAGYVLTANSAGTAPSFQVAASGGIITLNADSGSATGTTVTIAGAGSITTSATGSTLTITGSGGGSGFTWNNTTGSTQSMSVGNGYVDNGSGTPTVYTLPATAVVGSLVAVQGSGAGLWQVAQNSGQTIHFNAVDSTTGTGGSVSSTSQYDSIVLICITTNTEWALNQSVGNLSVV